MAGLRVCPQGLDADAAAGAIPNDGERRDPLTGKVHVAREHRVIDRGRSAKLDPADLDLAQAGRGQMLLHELLVLHDHGGQVDRAKLLSKPHLAHFGARLCHRQRDAPAQPQSELAHDLLASIAFAPRVWIAFCRLSVGMSASVGKSAEVPPPRERVRCSPGPP